MQKSFIGNVDPDQLGSSGFTLILIRMTNHMIDARIFLSFWRRGQGPVEFVKKKNIWTIKVGNFDAALNFWIAILNLLKTMDIRN